MDEVNALNSKRASHQNRACDIASGLAQAQVRGSLREGSSPTRTHRDAGSSIRAHRNLHSFAVASVAAGTAESMIWFCSARAVQGIGAAALAVVAPAAISQVCPESERGARTEDVRELRFAA
jgi:hypothetical protein